jgi:(2Fe-2S) ferredoxin
VPGDAFCPLTSCPASSTLIFRATQTLSLCLHQSSGRRQPERILRGQGLGTSVQSVERRSQTGVTVLVEPDHFFYGHVSVADVPEIVNGLVAGQPVKRLVITAD